MVRFLAHLLYRHTVPGIGISPLLFVEPLDDSLERQAMPDLWGTVSAGWGLGKHTELLTSNFVLLTTDSMKCDSSTIVVHRLWALYNSYFDNGCDFY